MVSFESIEYAFAFALQQIHAGLQAVEKVGQSRRIPLAEALRRRHAIAQADVV